MSDSLIFFWIGNEAKVERFYFKTKEGSEWSIGRDSKDLNLSPTLRRENQKIMDQVVKLSVSKASLEADRIKRYFIFSESINEHKINVCGENTLWYHYKEKQDKCLCKFTVYPFLDFVEDNNVKRTTGYDDSDKILFEGLKDLSMNFYSVLNSGHLSDVVLTNGSIQIKAHKVILAARSPVFEDMFINATEQIEENLIYMADIDDFALYEMVSFMYKGSVSDMTFSGASDVYVAADRYKISKLKSICIEILQDNLSSETVLDLLILADTHKDEKLKAEAMSFMYENFANFKVSNTYMSLPNLYPNLYQEILKFFVNKITF